MRRISTFAGFFLGSLLPVFAGDVTGQVIITKQLTRRVVSAPIYSLRGAAPGAAAVEKDAVNEFERTVLMLEGVKGKHPAPVTAVIEQRDGRFEPDLAV